jgi:hypothetical protein
VQGYASELREAAAAVTLAGLAAALTLAGGGWAAALAVPVAFVGCTPVHMGSFARLFRSVVKRSVHLGLGFLGAIFLAACASGTQHKARSTMQHTTDARMVEAGRRREPVQAHMASSHRVERWPAI